MFDKLHSGEIAGAGPCSSGALRQRPTETARPRIPTETVGRSAPPPAGPPREVPATTRGNRSSRHHACLGWAMWSRLAISAAVVDL